jgi:dihydroxy-acid dehydratase
MLAFVQNGDMIELDVEARQLNLLVAYEELAKRKQNLKLDLNKYTRGYCKLYVDHVEQSHLGADLDFLKGGSGSEVLRDSH